MDLLVSSKSSENRVALDSKSQWRIGRHRDNDIVTDDPLASRRHGRLVLKADGIYYEDLGTGNGTLVSSVSIPPNSLIEIKEDDIIEIGDYKLSFLKSGDDSSQSPSGSNRIAEGEVGILKDLAKEGKRALHILDEPSTLIGRSPICGIKVDDLESSRLNTEVVRKGDEFHIRDLGSSNGTYLNDKQVKKSVLAPDDVVRVGSHRFQFIVENEGAVRPSNGAAVSAGLPQSCSTILFGLITAIVTGTVVYFLTANKTSNAPLDTTQPSDTGLASAPIFVGQPLVQDISVQFEETGNVLLANQDIIPLPLGRKVARVHVENGQRVKKGMPLVTFEMPDELDTARKEAFSSYNQVGQDVAKAQSAVTKAEAVLDAARSTLSIIQNTHDRSRRVYQNGNLLQTEWDQILVKLAEARAAVKVRAADKEQAGQAVKQAQAGLALMEAKMDDIKSKIKDLTFTANTDGVVNGFKLRSGYTITPVNSTMEIIEYETEIKVIVSVSEDDIGLVRENMASDVWLPRAPDKTFRGKVTFIPPTAVNRNYSVEVTVPNKGFHFRPGQQASVRFLTGTKQGSLLVPSSAIAADPSSGFYLFTVNPATKVARRVSIKRGTEVAQSSGKYIEVLPSENGGFISKGDWIIFKGFRAVKDGMKVEIKNLDETTGFPQ